MTEYVIEQKNYESGVNRFPRIVCGSTWRLCSPLTAVLLDVPRLSRQQHRPHDKSLLSTGITRWCRLTCKVEPFTTPVPSRGSRTKRPISPAAGMLASFVICGVVSSLVSMVMMPRTTSSCGASGAIFGLYSVCVLGKVSFPSSVPAYIMSMCRFLA